MRKWHFAGTLPILYSLPFSLVTLVSSDSTIPTLANSATLQTWKHRNTLSNDLQPTTTCTKKTHTNTSLNTPHPPKCSKKNVPEIVTEWHCHVYCHVTFTRYQVSERFLHVFFPGPPVTFIPTFLKPSSSPLLAALTWAPPTRSESFQVQKIFCVLKAQAYLWRSVLDI